MRLCPGHGGQRGAAVPELHGGGLRLFCTQVLPCPCPAVLAVCSPQALEREGGLSEHEGDFRLGAISKLLPGDVVPPPQQHAKQRKDPL